MATGGSTGKQLSVASPNDPEESVNSKELNKLKDRRRQVRSQITQCKNLAVNEIEDRGSRSYVKSLVKKAEILNSDSQLLTEKITILLDPAKIKSEWQRQDYYDGVIIDLKAVLEDYIACRVDDTPSEIGELPSRSNQPTLAPQTPQNQMITPLPPANSNNPVTSTPEVNELLKNFQSTLEKKWEKLFNDHVNNSNSEVPKSFLPSTFVTNKKESPDIWIERYVEGQEDPDEWAGGHGSNSSIKTELSPYYGDALKWFEWIGIFKALVHNTGKSPEEKLAILKRSLKGECLDIVYGLGGGEEAYKEALIRLKESCGRRDVMRASHIQAISQLDPGRNNANAFKRYAQRVRTHLFDISRLGEKSNEDLIDRICAKLHPQDRLAWNTIKPRNDDNVDINEFGAWLCNRAAAYQDPIEIAKEQMRNPFKKPSSHTFQATESNNINVNRSECPLCSNDHWLEKCPEFVKMQVENRKRVLAKSSLCYRCFKPWHGIKNCKSRRGCEVKGCKSRHHTLLHEHNSETTFSNSALEGNSFKRVGLGIIKVWTQNTFGKKLRINVLVDEGSDTTLIRTDVLANLGIVGKRKPMILVGVGGIKREIPSIEAHLDLQTTDGKFVQIKARSLQEVSGNLPRVNWARLKRNYKHLEDLPLFEGGGRVDLLIGADNIFLINPSETREGGRNDPCAIKTKLGWVVRGPVEDLLYTNVANVNLTFGQADLDLNKLFERFCNTENFGSEHENATNLNQNEKLAMEIVEKGIVQLDPAGYECPLTWKEGEPKFENNRFMAEKAAERTYQRFLKDPEYEEACLKSLTKTIDSGYARKLEPEELNNLENEYYLIPFGVYKKSASEKKLRLVFNSAAKFKGKCLNDGLLVGPVLQNSLPIILTSFREGCIAFTSDVEAMFNRIRMNERDRRYHRFIFKTTRSKQLETYEMQRLSFGDACSPFIALYTLRKTADDHSNDDRVKEAIYKHTYMDDWLDSAQTVEEAVGLANEVRETLKKGDFNLHEWTSNSRDFLKKNIREN